MNQVEEYELRIRQQELRYEKEKLATAVAAGMKFIGTQIASYLDDNAYRRIMANMDNIIDTYIQNCGYLEKETK